MDGLERNRSAWDDLFSCLFCLCGCFWFCLFFLKVKASARRENLPRQETPCNLARELWRGIERGRRNGKTQVEQGRPRIQNWGVIVVFSLQSLHAQEARGRVLALIRYSKSGKVMWRWGIQTGIRSGKLRKTTPGSCNVLFLPKAEH